MCSLFSRSDSNVVKRYKQCKKCFAVSVFVVVVLFAGFYFPARLQVGYNCFNEHFSFFVAAKLGRFLAFDRV